LFFQAISKIIEVLTIDGKAFDFNSNFRYQRVKHSTKIIFFDDVPKNFDFERLFSVISEGIPVERKGKDEFYISFESSPKIAISTNYAIQADGNSVERRKMILEFSEYFSTQKTPFEEYKKYMFIDWSVDEWQKFDNFMISCIQLYFKKGMRRPENNNNALRKVMNATPQGFIEFIEGFEVNEKHDKKELTNSLKEFLAFKNLGTATSMKYVKIYCDFKGFIFSDGHSGRYHWFMMQDINKEKQT
jgi:hypothetical protein